MILPNLKPAIKAVIFDCDGTLVDSEEAHHAAWQRAVLNWNYPFSYDLPSHAGKSDESIAELLADTIRCDCADAILAEKNRYYRALVKEGLPPIKETVDFVHRLAAEKQSLGIKLGIASAASTEDILANLENLEIRGYFDVILSGQNDLHAYQDPNGVNKPKPYVYLHAAKLLSVSPEECAVVEDSATGVSASAAAGCFTFAVPNRFTMDHDFSLAAIKIETFSNVSVEQFFEMISISLMKPYQ